VAKKRRKGGKRGRKFGTGYYKIFGHPSSLIVFQHRGILVMKFLPYLKVKSFDS
jgi:hypothetical protein